MVRPSKRHIHRVTPYFIIRYNDGDTEREVPFSDDSALQAWLGEVERFNRNYAHFPGKEGGYQDASARINEHINGMIGELRRTLSKQNIANNRKHAEEQVRSILNQRQLVVPDSGAGKLLTDLGATDARAAFAALILLLNSDWLLLEHPNVRDTAYLPPYVAKAVAAVGMYERGYGETHAILKQKIEELLRAAETTKAEVEERLAAADALVSAFESKLKTDQAFQFWIDKHSKHETDARKYLKIIRWFGGIAGLITILTFVLLYTTSGDIRTIDAPLWVPASVGFLLLAVVWIGRILVRLYLTQVNLKEDAAERAVMVQTFVALVKEGAAHGEHLNIVLQSLFRPALKAGNTDDAAPQLPTEILIKRVVGGKE